MWLSFFYFVEREELFFYYGGFREVDEVLFFVIRRLINIVDLGLSQREKIYF